MTTPTKLQATTANAKRSNGKHGNVVRRPIRTFVVIDRPSDMVRLKNANYAIFSGQIVRLERPIMR